MSELNGRSPTVADAVVNVLLQEGVNTVFSLIATSILDLFDALARQPEVRVVVAQHEQGVAFMSDGYARVTGRPAICLVSAGPGATNAITGIAQAYHESCPVVVISSETATQIHGRGRSNFHEVDQLSLFRPITKWAVRAERPECVVPLLRRAFHIATTGRLGPVYVGIPKDFLLQPAIEEGVIMPTPTLIGTAVPEDVKRAADMLCEAKRPFILAGGGVLWSGGREALQNLAEKLTAPVAATPWHRGILSDAHPLGVGQLGNTGTQPALTLAAEADVILVVGSTLSELTTDRYSYRIIPQSAQLIQIDIDPEEVGKNYPVVVGLVGDAQLILNQLTEEVEMMGGKQNSARLQHISTLKQAWHDWLVGMRKEDKCTPIGRLTVYHLLRDLLERDALVFAESGGTAAYTRFALPAYEPQILPGDYSAMGSGYCMALGAKIAYPERQVVSLSGDGAFMMVLSELQTAVEQHINTTAIIFHNNSYANMRYKQTQLFAERYLGVDFHYPNFAQIARDFGAWGEQIERADQLVEGITAALNAGQPAVLDIITDPENQIPPSDIYKRWIQERQMELAYS